LHAKELFACDSKTDHIGSVIQIHIGCFNSAKQGNIIRQAFIDLELTKQALEDVERIDLLWMPFDEAIEKIASGEIKDGLTAIALLRAQAYLQNLE